MIVGIDVHVERDPQPGPVAVDDPVRLVDVVMRELVPRLPAAPAERADVDGVGAGLDAARTISRLPPGDRSSVISRLLARWPRWPR